MTDFAVRQIEDGRWAVLALDTASTCPRVGVVGVICCGRPLVLPAGLAQYERTGPAVGCSGPVLGQIPCQRAAYNPIQNSREIAREEACAGSRCRNPVIARAEQTRRKPGAVHRAKRTIQLPFDDPCLRSRSPSTTAGFLRGYRILPREVLGDVLRQSFDDGPRLALLLDRHLEP